MLEDSLAFGGFSVPHPDAARTFPGETLGLRTEDGNGAVFTLKLGGGRDTLVYPNPGHQPASHTLLSFPVDDIEAAVDELTAGGLKYEQSPNSAGAST